MAEFTIRIVATVPVIAWCRDGTLFCNAKAPFTVDKVSEITGEVIHIGEYQGPLMMPFNTTHEDGEFFRVTVQDS